MRKKYAYFKRKEKMKRNYKETCELIDIFKGGEYGYK